MSDHINGDELPVGFEAWLEQVNEIVRLESGALDAVREATRIAVELPWLRERLASWRDGVRSADGMSAAKQWLGDELAASAAELEAALGERAAAIPALIVLLLLPMTEEKYAERSIPRSVLVDTMSDLGIWMNRYRLERGRWGLDNWQWLFNHLFGRLHRVGRLQYVLRELSHPVAVLRHAQSGELAVLAGTGPVYRADGREDGTNGIHDDQTSWSAVYGETPDAYEGNTAIRRGVAYREDTKLLKPEWQLELQTGDVVLELHIPEGEPLNVDSCRDSLQAAVPFYAQHYGERPVRGFVCTSWLLDPQLQDLLPATSNIVRFQRLLHLLPARSDERETYYRVFGSYEIDPATAPRDSGLRRAIADFAAGGGLLHAAAGVLPVSELERR